MMASTLPEWTRGANLNEWAADHGGISHIHHVITEMSNAALQRLINGEGGYPRKLRSFASDVMEGREGVQGAAESVQPSKARREAVRPTGERAERVATTSGRGFGVDTGGYYKFRVPSDEPGKRT